MPQRWKRRPEGSTWGDFGPDDENGRIGLLTPDRVRAAIAEAREGRTFCLSLPLDYPGGSVLNPHRHPPRLFAAERRGKPTYNYVLADERELWTDVVSDDAVLLYTQYSTQWDSLAHVGGLFDADGDGAPEVVYYNGWRGGDDVVGPAVGSQGEGCSAHEGSHAHKLGIDKLAERCVQGRGVMIDLHADSGEARKLVGYDDLMRVMEADRVVVEEGDMVCLHTGFARMVLEMRKSPEKEKLRGACAVLDGRDPKLLEWITESGLAALIADNYAVEAFPSEPGEGRHAFLPLHEHCLFKLGVHRRALVPFRSGLRAAGGGTQPFPADRTAAQAARSRRIARDASGDDLRCSRDATALVARPASLNPAGPWPGG